MRLIITSLIACTLACELGCYRSPEAQSAGNLVSDLSAAKAAAAQAGAEARAATNAANAAQAESAAAMRIAEVARAEATLAQRTADAARADVAVARADAEAMKAAHQSLVSQLNRQMRAATESPNSGTLIVGRWRNKEKLYTSNGVSVVEFTPKGFVVLFDKSGREFVSGKGRFYSYQGSTLTVWEGSVSSSDWVQYAADDSTSGELHLQQQESEGSAAFRLNPLQALGGRWEREP